MKQLRITALLTATLALPPVFCVAATCKPLPARCTACRDCSACKLCNKRGGVCSVCQKQKTKNRYRLRVGR